MTEIRFYSLDREEVEDFILPLPGRIISERQCSQLSMQKGISRHRVVLLLLVATTSSAVVAWFALKYTSNFPMRFERTRWVQARSQEDTWVLKRMSKDLIERKALIGETRSQLIEMLGAPENYSDATDRQMYYLIREDIDGVDPVRRDHLLISLDQNSRVVDARIVVFEKRGRR